MKENRNLLKEIISMTILICIIFSCTVTYAACAKSGGSTNNGNTDVATDNGGNSAETTTGDEFDPHLPDADYGGTDFRILDIDQASEWWAIIDLDIAEDAINSTGTALNDPVVNQAIYTRNRNIEEKYNFIVKETQMPAAKVASTLKNSVNAGSDDYDLVSPQTQDAPAMATGNMLVDLNKVPHLNFDNPWWNNSVSNYFSMGGRLFFTCSDFTLSDKDNVAVFMYNKKLSETLGIDSADALYTLVDQGKWTFDKFKELCK
ncbi:MAG: ABC transporter substrate-binding protein, partial [Oscillospiraceae bacterium]|nr:ABC transporter substrate-binding protein [Oscillospiraceae bacterium]